MLVKIIVSVLVGIAVFLLAEVLGSIFNLPKIVYYAGTIGIIAGIAYFIWGSYPARSV